MARPKTYHISDSDLEQIYDLLLKGVTVNQVAKTFGTSRETIRRLLRKAGYTLPDVYIPVLRDFTELPNDWRLAFVGLFMGEGTVALRYLNTRYIPRPELHMAFRIDDAALLIDIQTRLGGGALKYREGEVYTTETRNPSVMWSLVGWGTVYSVLKLFDDCPLPAKKLREISLLKEACEYRFTLPRTVGTVKGAHERLNEYYKRIRLLKKFNGG